jgi:hypothetical protein
MPAHARRVELADSNLPIRNWGYRQFLDAAADLVSRLRYD